MSVWKLFVVNFSSFRLSNYYYFLAGMETVDGVFRKQLGAPVSSAREHVGCLRGPRINHLQEEGIADHHVEKCDQI